MIIFFVPSDLMQVTTAFLSCQEKSDEQPERGVNNNMRGMNVKAE